VESVTVPKAIVAEGVQNAVVLDVLGAVAFVTVTPPAEYPDPDTSLVELYAVVAAPREPLTRNKAHLTVSDVVAPRVTVVPSAW